MAAETERPQRRLAAILAADVAGYSRLVRGDEEGTLSALKAHLAELFEPTIADHRGRIFKTMGDGLLAEFASVVDAVRCALEIQDAMAARNEDVADDRRITFRVAVHLGDVVAEGDDLYGDGVNVASRLEGLVEPGHVCVSASAFELVRDKLSVGFEDLGEQRLKNIDRPLRAYRVLAAPDQAGRVIGPPGSNIVRWRRLAAVSALVVAVAAGAGAWLRPWAPALDPPSAGRTAPPPFADKPSIAVLPFENLGGDPSQDYFSDGLTEDIVNALGRYPTLAVMAYNAVLPYKRQAVRPAEAGRALGVRYLVQGSVRRAGRRVRVSIRLTDAKKGLLLWSERFDRELDDVFAVQDAITRRVAGTLIVNLTRIEQKRALAKPTGNLDAYDLVLRGRAGLRRASRGGNRQARRMFERAAKLDANYAAAYAWLGRAHYQMATDGWTEFPGESLKRAEELAQKALSIDPRTIEGHRTLSRVHAIQFQLERAITEIDRAVALNPSDAEAHGDRGVILLWAGRLEEAAASLETAFAFDPNLRGDFVLAHGLAYYSLRRHREAISVLERGAARYADYVFIPAALVAAYGQIGRTAEARRNAEKVRRILPIFDPAVFGSRFQNRAHYEYLAEGLRKGGLE